MPRIISRLSELPSTMKPAMSTSSAAATRIRVEIFARCELDVGVAVGELEGVAVTVGSGDAVAVGTGVAVGVGVPTGVAVAVVVGVAVGLAVGVEVGVAVGVGVGAGAGTRQGWSQRAAFTITLPQSPL